MHLENRRNVPVSLNSQSGFSMIEMLMTAFILAIGILGLSMLQVMSLKASRGSRSLTTAVQVGEKVMDQVEMEGRLTWLNLTDTNLNAAAVAASPLTGLKYVNLTPSTTVGFTQTFNIKGREIPATSTDPTDLITYYTVTTFALPTDNAIVVGGGATANMHDFTVTVDFVDQTNANASNAAIHRTVTITRRIVHA